MPLHTNSKQLSLHLQVFFLMVICRLPTAPAQTFEGAMCREACYKGEGFWDPFKPVKDEENCKALKLLPGVLKCVCTSTLSFCHAVCLAMHKY